MICREQRRAAPLRLHDARVPDARVPDARTPDARGAGRSAEPCRRLQRVTGTRASRRRDGGFTLVEVLVTLAILAVVLAALGRGLGVAHRASQAVDSEAERQQAITLVSALLRYDLGAAGYVRPDLEPLLEASQASAEATVGVQPMLPALPAPVPPVVAPTGAGPSVPVAPVPPGLPVPAPPVPAPPAPVRTGPPLGRTLVAQPLVIRRHPGSSTGDGVWVRYLEDKELDEPKLRDYRFSAGVDGRGEPQLYRSEGAGTRQPLVQGLSSLRVVSIAYEGGWHAVDEAETVRDPGGSGGDSPGAGRPAAAAHGLRLALGFAWGESVELVVDLPNAPVPSVENEP